MGPWLRTGLGGHVTVSLDRGRGRGSWFGTAQEERGGVSGCLPGGRFGLDRARFRGWSYMVFFIVAAFPGV